MKAILQRDPHGELGNLVERVLIGAALLLMMLLVGVQLARVVDPGSFESVTGGTSSEGDTEPIP